MQLEASEDLREWVLEQCVRRASHPRSGLGSALWSGRVAVHFTCVSPLWESAGRVGAHYRYVSGTTLTTIPCGGVCIRNMSFACLPSFQAHACTGPVLRSRASACLHVPALEPACSSSAYRQ